MTDSYADLAVRQEQIRRKVKRMGPNLDACFVKGEGLAKFMVRGRHFQNVHLPVIASTLEILKSMADDDVRILISVMSGGKI